MRIGLVTSRSSAGASESSSQNPVVRFAASAAESVGACSGSAGVAGRSGSGWTGKPSARQRTPVGGEAAGSRTSARCAPVSGVTGIRRSSAPASTVSRAGAEQVAQPVTCTRSRVRALRPGRASHAAASPAPSGQAARDALASSTVFTQAS